MPSSRITIHDLILVASSSPPPQLLLPISQPANVSQSNSSTLSSLSDKTRDHRENVGIGCIQSASMHALNKQQKHWGICTKRLDNFKRCVQGIEKERNLNVNKDIKTCFRKLKTAIDNIYTPSHRPPQHRIIYLHASSAYMSSVCCKAKGNFSFINPTYYFFIVQHRKLAIFHCLMMNNVNVTSWLFGIVSRVSLSLFSISMTMASVCVCCVFNH